jgi:murein DD-endopeptidase MepM/ murein hydrolase activator NlpD
MNPQTLLNRPQTSPAIVPRISKIGSLVETSNKAKKSSTALRKVFEKGTYQKKIQASVLKRQKKKLDILQKENDKKFFKRKPVKLKLPEIKKYAGNFFTKGSANDPLKAIGALAAFNTAQKLSNKDYLGAIAPGLVAAGLAFGPSLLKGGIGMMRRGGGKETSGSGSTLLSKTPYSQTRAGQSYAGMQAQRNLPGWAQKAAGGSASRFAASNERLIQGTANIGDRSRVLSRGFGFGGVGGMAENIATRGGGRAVGSVSARVGGTAAAKAAGVGARAIPLLGAALNIGLSAYRFSQGDVVGGILSAVSAIPIVGWAALGVDLAREFGALDGTILGRKGTLQKQTAIQKKAIEDKKKEEQGGLTFGKTLNRYEKVVDKFTEISKSFKITAEGQFDEPPMPAPTRITPGSGYTGPISGDTFFPLPGGDVGTQGNVGPGQAFGAPRDGRSHEGLDMTHWKGALDAPVSAYKTGKVVAAVSNGYNGYVEIDHGGGLRTLYYHTTPMVSVGEEVYGGQQIAKLYPAGQSTHLHFGISNNGTYVDPLSHVQSVKNKLPSSLTRERAKQQHDSSSQTARPQSASLAIPLQEPAPVNPRSTRGSTEETLRNMGQTGAADALRRQRDMGPQSSSMGPSSSSIASASVTQRPSFSSPSPQPIMVPIPIPQPQQQVASVPVGGGMMVSGPSQQQLLNSFYKKVLLNTV